MWIVYTPVLFLAVILYSIEFTSQSDCSPHDELISGAPHCRSPHSSDRRHTFARAPLHIKTSNPASLHEVSPQFQWYRTGADFPDTPRPVSRPDSACRPQFSANNLSTSHGRSASLRIRSRTPPARFSSSTLLPVNPPFLAAESSLHPEHQLLPSSDFDVLDLVRLVPRTNPGQRFEFRRYVFPPNQRLLRKIGRNKYEPIPAQEFTVLSTANGDIFAIFEDDTGVLRGLYNIGRRRAKINMESHKVRSLRAEEKEECQVGQQIKPVHYRIVYA